MRDYRNLDVWQMAHEATLRVYSLTQTFPDDERFGLRAQLRRSMASVGSNIAEGSGRSSQSDFARFIEIAAGSVSEAEYQLLLSRDLGYVTGNEHRELSEKVARIRMMLAALAVRLRSNHHP
jgi:four helix bundle protein